MSARAWITAVLAASMLTTGCVIAPASTAGKACHLLNTALLEADMPPVWYDQTGDVLAACGIKDARDVAAEKACSVQQRNGYSCEVTP